MDTLTNTFGKLTIPLLVLFAICFSALPAQAKYGGGKGEPNDPYQIGDANHMQAIGADANDWDKHFLLTNDIDLSTYTGTQFNMIGNSEEDNFKGVFDGNFYTISHFTYASIYKTGVGIFRYIGEDAVLKNLYLENVYVDCPATNRYDHGGLVGGNLGGTIINCHLTGTVIGNYPCGGLVGENNGTIESCSATGNFIGWGLTGGLVGYNRGGLIKNCFVIGDVYGPDSTGALVGKVTNGGTVIDSWAVGTVEGGMHIGGLIGSVSCGDIIRCYFEGDVIPGTNSSSIGGLIGHIMGPGNVTQSSAICTINGSENVKYAGGLIGRGGGISINQCFATGTVSGGELLGGLVGYMLGGVITNCSSSTSVSGNNYVGGLLGASGKSTDVGYCTVVNSYSTGSVIAGASSERIGGLCGACPGLIKNSFWNIETGGPDNGLGIPKTTLEMQNPNTFISAGWDFVGETDNGISEVWQIPSGSYPLLSNLSGYVPLELTGEGTLENPYLISNANELGAIGHYQSNAHYQLTANIDLFGITFSSAPIPWFDGSFDGNNHIISNLIIDAGGYVGLFGHIVTGGDVKNLGLVNVSVTGDDASQLLGGLCGYNNGGYISRCYATGSVAGGIYLGGLCGYNNGGYINNCYATGSVAGKSNLGGLCGYNSKGTINNCHATCSVTGGDYSRLLGGLCGNNSRGNINNCYATGSVSGGDYSQQIGGLCGKNGYGSINACYTTGSITGWATIGGLSGWNYKGSLNNCSATGPVTGIGYSQQIGGLCGANSEGDISFCYATGTVLGDSSIGGLIGKNFYSNVSNCFWDMETSGQVTSDGGTGKTTAEMQTQSTFSDAGWDFVGETVNGIEDIWFIPQQDYPHLWWEGMQVPMKLTPRTLNCRSKGKWVKAHITLPEGFTVADVDSNRPAVLHSFGFQSLPLYVSVNENELVEIEAAFEREAVCSLAGDWPEAFTVAGFLTDGNIFLGTSTVRMITPGLKEIEELALYWLNADCVHPEFCDGIDLNRDSLVNWLDYALLLNSQVEFGSE